MNKIILSLSFLLLATASYAFESGTYKCKIAGVDVNILLKANGKAKYSSQWVNERGFWNDEDDAALVIKKDWIIEQKADGKFVWPLGTGFVRMEYPCQKVK